MKKKRLERSSSLIKSLSSKQKAKLENHHEPKSIGCMSGILHLVSKFHHRRKLITAGEKKGKDVISPSVQKLPDSGSGRVLCEIKRSPTITSEIRRSGSTDSPDVVAQLMKWDSPASVTEKRRKLIESLQKCEEDLNSLKKLIIAVQSSTTAEIKVEGGDRPGTKRKECLIVEVDGGDAMKQHELNSEQPSPVSVLENLSCSPNTRGNDCTQLSLFHKITLEALPRLFNHREDYSSLPRMSTKTSVASHFWSSKAKVESVNDVFQEAVCEERWELERIAVMLEDYMFGDLIEEMVRELGCCYFSSLPFDTCRRRLVFR